MLATVKARLDNWASALTGLGTIRDKFESYLFQKRGVLSTDTLEAMYHEDDMAAKACDSPAQHMLRRGWKYKGLDANATQYLKKELQRLAVREKLIEALTWEALYGGAAIFVGADDGRALDQALSLADIKRVPFITIAEARDLTPHRWYSNITDDKYGHVSVWALIQSWMGLQLEKKTALPEELEKLRKEQYKHIHETRMVVFPGRLVSKNERQRRNGWGGSVVEKSYSAIKTFHINWAAVSHILQDASQGVFKMKNLIEIMGSKGGKERLQTRMELIDMSRSVARSLLIDADGEEFERRDSSMAGLPDLLDRTGSRLASSFSMPVTILMGISPAGLNATGQSDVRNWYDQLEADRSERLSPRIKYLTDVLLQQEGSPCKGSQLAYEIEYPPLWQMTEDEEAEVRSKNASTDASYVQAGIIRPEAMGKLRWTADGYQHKIDLIDWAASAESTRLYDLLQEKLGHRTTDQPEAELEPAPKVTP